MKPLSRKAICIYGVFLGLSFIFWTLMFRNFFAYPYIAEYDKFGNYGQNGQHDLPVFSIIMLIELTILLVIIRPRSYHLSYIRSLLAFSLFFAWTYSTFWSILHSGGIIYFHQLWLIAITASLLIMTVISLMARLIKKYKKPLQIR